MYLLKFFNDIIKFKKNFKKSTPREAKEEVPPQRRGRRRRRAKGCATAGEPPPPLLHRPRCPHRREECPTDGGPLRRLPSPTGSRRPPCPPCWRRPPRPATKMGWWQMVAAAPATGKWSFFICNKINFNNIN